MQNNNMHLHSWNGSTKKRSLRNLFKPISIATQTSSIKWPYSRTVQLPFEPILNPRSIDLSIYRSISSHTTKDVKWKCTNGHSDTECAKVTNEPVQFALFVNVFAYRMHIWFFLFYYIYILKFFKLKLYKS